MVLASCTRVSSTESCSWRASISICGGMKVLLPNVLGSAHRVACRRWQSPEQQLTLLSTRNESRLAQPFCLLGHHGGHRLDVGVRGLRTQRDLAVASAELRMCGGGCRISWVRCNRVVVVPRCGPWLNGNGWQRRADDHGVCVLMKLRRGGSVARQCLRCAGRRVWLLIRSCEGIDPLLVSMAACRVIICQLRMAERTGLWTAVFAKRSECS